jgi:hypothetical protein
LLPPPISASADIWIEAGATNIIPKPISRATFLQYITQPLLRLDQSVEERTQRITPTTRATRGLSVLVVDDIESNRSEKQQTLPFVSSGAFRLMNILEVWTGEEWSRVRRVIRHKTIKQMYRVLTHTGCVDVTEDHSLLDKNKEKIKPTELSIGSELYHSFPPKEDFLEIEIKDSIIEGKVYECIKCKEHKLQFEFYKDYIKICKECVFTQNHSTPSQRGSPYYISETEYIRNPSNYLCEDLSLYTKPYL